MLLPRLVALGRYVTPDEPLWLMRSANFYQALSELDLRNTYQAEHPGVPITWAGMAGFLRVYPHYIDARPGQIKSAEKLSTFLNDHQISALELLVAGRFFVVMGIVGTLAAAYLTAARLLGPATALTGFLLIAFDPFVVSLTRLLHVDGVMSTLMLLSLLAYLRYLYAGRNRLFLLLSGVAAGLSWLTKSAAFSLVPFICLIATTQLLLSLREHPGNEGSPALPIATRLGTACALVGAWVAVACATFFLLWPAMWIDPLTPVKSIFYQALAYTEGHDAITFFNGRIYGIGESAWYFYPVSFFWRTSPVVLAGVALALLGLILRRSLRVSVERQQVILYLVFFAVLFALCMSLSHKKSSRYILPTHLAAELVAAFGWVTAVGYVIRRFAARRSTALQQLSTSGCLAAVVGIQLAATLQTYPYYCNWFNPLMGGSRKAVQMMGVGWGEGLDQAARYLDGLPDADEKRVIAWYGEGSLSYFFRGTTVALEVDDKLDTLRKADYVVLYVNQWQRGLPSQDVLNYFQQLTPEYIARMGDVDYARVYNMHNSPEPPRSLSEGIRNGG
jgi:hypothetical protein